MPTELFSRLKSHSPSGMWTSRSAGLVKGTFTSLRHSRDFCETRPHRDLRGCQDLGAQRHQHKQVAALCSGIGDVGLSTTPRCLRPETPYKIFCFAEDDWVGSRLLCAVYGICGPFLVQVVQSTAGAVSPNFVAPTSPNKSSAALQLFSYHVHATSLMRIRLPFSGHCRRASLSWRPSGPGHVWTYAAEVQCPSR